MKMKNSYISFLLFSLLVLTLSLSFVSAVPISTMSHTSSADLQPEWSVPAVTNPYDVVITNTGGDPIDEVRIMQNPLYTGFTCDSKADWTLVPVANFPDPELGIIDICWYFTDDSHAITSGNSETFEFDATAPSEDPRECALKWKFETRDNQDFWRTIYDTTNIDSEAPETTKTYDPFVYIDPQTQAEYISTGTLVELTPEDMSLECGIGVEDTEYRVSGALADRYCEPANCEGWMTAFRPDMGAWNLFESPFPMNDESCHVIEYRSTDLLGNEEDIKWQCVYVDDTAPYAGVITGKPKISCGDDTTCDYWVRDHWTPITLTCVEDEPHPSGIKSIEYRWKLDGSWPINNLAGNWLTYTDPIIFLEDSYHQLEYRCTDNVGHVDSGSIDYRVDSQPPIITKTMIGDKHLAEIGTCPPAPEPSDDMCYVADNGENGVMINVAEDMTYPECAVGGVQCSYELWWETTSKACTEELGPEHLYNSGTGECFVEGGSFGTEGEDVIFNEDSTHTLKIWCEDDLGNDVYDEEIFLVDSMPPVTTKTYGSPTFTEGDYRWIDITTDITLDAVDVKVGVEGIYYMNEWVSDDLCEAHPEPASSESPTGDYVIPSTNNANRDNDWAHVNELSVGLGQVELEFVQPRSLYSCFEYRTDGDTNQVIDEEHFLEFYGVVDYSAGLQQYPYFCLSTPSAQIETIFANEYVEIRMIHGGESDERFDWTRFDVIPDMSAWSYVADDTVTFTIPDESCHVVQYYAVDLLGNAESVQKQFVMVDDSTPITDQSYSPDSYVDDSNGWEYIDTVHEVVLTSRDPLPHPSGVAETQYRVSGALANRFCEPVNCDGWMTAFRPDMGAWNTYVDPFKINEESCHVIEYRSIDNVGKTEDIKWQCVFVDKTLPEIRKTYIGSQSPAQIGPNTPYPHYINSETLVNIEALDLGPHPSGIDFIEYDVELLDGNEACNDDLRCQQIQTQHGWTLYEDAFTIPEDSCHMINIRAVDNVGKTSYHRQCVFVDNKAPEIVKEITGPQMDANEPVHKYLTDESVINLECADVDPHPVGEEIIRWEMYWKYDNCDVDDDWSLIDSGEQSDSVEFTDLEDSCHKFVYWCEDALGNTQEVKNVEIDIVDNKAPTPTKTVGEVSTEWLPVHVDDDPFNPDATHFYDWIVDKCRVDPEVADSCADGVDCIDCWKVTLDTEITMDCSDPDPHPVENERVCFQVEMDGEDITDGDACDYKRCGRPEGYCAEYGDYMTDDGWCCTDKIIEDFTFLEESEHNLKYYCEDALGNSNKDDVDEEKFKVSGKMFKIRLNDKWNLISVPFVLQEDDPKQVFSDAESVQTVWSYDAETGDWSVYRSENEAISDLEHIEPGLGYWVLSDCEEPLKTLTMTDRKWKCDSDKCEMLVVGGSLYSPGPVTPPSQDLPQGWSLIGLYGDENNRNRYGYYGPNEDYGWNSQSCGWFDDGKDAYCELSSLRSQEGSIKWNALIGYWEPKNPRAWYDLNQCDEMDVGAGYWIFMNDEGTYAPSTIICDDEICEEEDGGFFDFIFGP